MAAPRVIHTAQALVDAVVEVPRLPARGGNVMATSSRRYAGGAVTTLLAAARSGARAVHAGSVGTGPNGDLVRAVLEAEGVALSAPRVDGLDTGVCLVLVEPTAERSFVTTEGAERQVTPASLATSAPAAGDFVCVSGYSLAGATRDPLLAWLESLPAHVHVVLDPGAAFAEAAPRVREAVLARTAVWTGNAEEAETLAGVHGLAEAAQVVAGLLPPGAVTVVRDGPRGCLVREGGRESRLPGHPQRPVDTNGAGDTHTGVLLAERVAGLGWPQAAVRANAAGALTVTRRGPDTAPTRAEIDAFLERAR
ncbi:sugar kinase [Phycicoccus endophyticus]|uniref:Sugar kinase n=1 Tax=Phycicoccus endophyticus TaxID=1690220 RepID=A0A7G9R2Z2_9MICO|nr:PfkB family carbohydrate kinase [Phycicoccus endophyticus]NHI20258.1 sugar kinase [Phycicoccus endophyticus]QNN49967.1 sugar kinase [Phycicoccus endophyticus]GGL29217.1 sugar kinase [Phycicoccus endophyticus]